MPSNVLVTVCVDEEWIDILKNLEQKCDWKVRYFVGFPEMEERARNTFNGVLFEDVGDFLTGLEFPDKYLAESKEISALPEKPFEFALLEKLSKYEFMAKYIINRENEKGSDRTNEIYFDLINYWLKIIDFTKPSIIIVPWTPYTAREYVLFALSQILNIKFLTFRQSNIRSYLYMPMGNPHTIFLDDVISQYNNLKNITPLPLKFSDFKIQKYAMQRIQEMGDLNCKNILIDDYKKIQSNANLNIFAIVSDHIINTAKNIKNLGKSKLSQFFSNELSIQNRIHFLFDLFRKVIRYSMANIRNFIHIRANVKKLNALKWIYDAYCIEPDYNRPYIFFPLHYQPEQTTAPFGNYAVYQNIPIEMIARSIPDNWVIYVKEHYATFSPQYGGWKKRTKEYYERISKIPNVFLIPTETPSAVLIDHSKAVATIAGSAGLEGVLRRKPVLTFGSAWYNGCEGIFPIQNHNMCKDIIEKIRLGIEIDPNQMLLFVQATESVGAKVNFSFSMKNVGDESITREETIMNMTECISNWWMRQIKCNDYP